MSLPKAWRLRLAIHMFYYELVRERRANPQDDMISRLTQSTSPATTVWRS